MIAQYSKYNEYNVGFGKRSLEGIGIIEMQMTPNPSVESFMSWYSEVLN